MGKKPEQIESAGVLRIYRAPWKGELVLACKKCQRKIRKHDGPGALGKISRWFRRRTKENPDAAPVRVIEIPCVKLCPKGGVTIFSQRQLAHQPSGVCIARSEEDLEAFYQLLIPAASVASQ